VVVIDIGHLRQLRTELALSEPSEDNERIYELVTRLVDILIAGHPRTLPW